MGDVRLALIEDNPRYRATLGDFFRFAQGFELAGVYGSAERFLEAARFRADAGERLPWDMVLMDVELPGISGIQATRDLKKMSPDLPVVMLTMFEEPSTILEAISAGADGYLLKRSKSRELLDQLRSISEGGAPLTSGVARTVLDLLRSGDGRFAPVEGSAPGGLSLTEREQEVLRCLVNGSSYQEAADELGVTIHTIRFHIKGIYGKLQVHSVAEAVRRAVRERLV
ncbi:MAG: response regulator transcription factor [Acidobacteria bacterium]|uniref:Response regulator transcription factor n=1 Tax=Candidatus Polarisedimenticola svalbardensis TaxID=2886004 RepID=A0A8J6XSC0_9BACT|nr:response regulator transcription factor [Candidatus Polarisedimenticola svalbardensis]